MSHPLVQSMWLIPLYTMLGAALSFFLFSGITRRTGPRPAGYLNIVMTLTAFIHSSIALIYAWDAPAVDFSVPWLNVASLDLSIPFHIDAAAITACVVITGLNLMAQVFAMGYLEMDWGWARFFSLMAFFEAGMNFLVLTDSLFFSYIALELLTLGTYLLVGLWFNQSLVVTGARDAFLTKRIGDLFLLMGVVALLPIAGTWNYTELAEWAKTADVDPTLMGLLGFALLFGPMGKCAQFPLHLWLDEAMEGPVPGTILRNAIVVQVGAWVVVKLQPVLSLSPPVRTATLVIGSITAVGGALIAIAQVDIKRNLSYPTSAYMGLVFIAVGTGHTQAALLLSVTHALGMALMVMSSSAVIWNSVTQDVTQLGGLWSRRPISGISLAIGAAGLVALPPFGGFWAILRLVEDLWASHSPLCFVVLAVNLFLSFSFTRLFCRVFLGQPGQMSERCPEVHWPMALPMVVTTGFMLHVPILLSVVGLLPDWLSLDKGIALVVIWSTLTGIGGAAAIYLGNFVQKPVRLPWPGLQDLFAYDFYTPQLYRNTVVLVVSLFSKLVNWFDQYLIDGIANFFGLATLVSGQSLKYSTSGQSQFYILTILLGLTVIGLWLSLPLLSNLSVIQP
ncbi:NAD(P)H-quinone oxidoreductase subunit F [filamentous cyanobacterium LEGE 11480]|uniref:NAD(P)H-quinone oxidoreductase subunit F n=1 Tax=Romeriopsis navalis LEGE 11480 TaxID=2777977 RepID=A0A928Z4R5_9CYAN|nr:NAD(P)H-quinone oxidoreductase subunit F [Romeriopsis navalis]MBE9030648.1 NAD(P)H-quinone oxidoreductase subunit F [Romeriopsis navalis LEGE 11480]